MKKIFLLSFLLGFTTIANAEYSDLLAIPKVEDLTKAPLLLQCDVSRNVVTNRIDRVNSDIMDDHYWSEVNRQSFYIVLFGSAWEDIEESCYAYPAYVETTTRVRRESYMEKKECEFGPVGSGTYQMRDAWGGFFTMDVQNHYASATSTCKVKVNAALIQGNINKVNWSKRQNCQQAKKHFLNLIKDPDYGKDAIHREWQKEKCREISLHDFEAKTGLFVSKFIHVVAEDIVQ